MQKVKLSDDSGDYKIGWIRTGEWLNYTCEVSEEGHYDFNFRVSSLDGGGRVSVFANGTKIIDDEVIITTGDWENWATQTIPSIYLGEGTTVIRIHIKNLGWNLNYFEVEPSNITSTESLTFSKVSLYPNPSNGQFILESLDGNIERFTVSDMNGKLILQQNLNTQKTAFGNALKPGVYLLMVFINGQQKYFKIIKT